jgi:6-phosphogluconolactonase
MLRKKVFVLAFVTMLVCFAAMPLAQALTKVGKFAYVTENGQIDAYVYDPASGRLRSIQSVPYTGPVNNPIRVNPTSKFAYAPTTCGNGSGNPSPLYGFKVGTNGTLTTLPGFPLSVPASDMAFTPNGKFAYTVDYCANNVDEYSVNATTGALTSIGSFGTNTAGGNVVITSKGTFVYIPNVNTTGTVSVYAINPTTGLLTSITGSPFVTGTQGPEYAVLTPNGKFLLVYSFDGSTAVFAINATTGALIAVAGSPFSGPANVPGGYATIDPTGHFYYAALISSSGVAAYSINQTTGALTQVSGSPFAAGSAAFGVTVDPGGKYLYVTNQGSNESPVFVFFIDPTTGALTEVLSEGLVGQQGALVTFTTGTAAVKYTPTFAYATNSGSKSIAELSIASGGLTVTGTLTDANGPQTSAASSDNKFFYTGNANGSISEYKIGSTGALSKIRGSPITGLTNPVALAIRSFDTNSCGPYNWLYAVDQAANDIDVYDRNPTTGVLSLSSVASSNGNSPSAMAVDPFGAFTLVANTVSNDIYIGEPCVGFLSSVAAGAGPVAMTIDPSNQFVYAANSGDNTVSAYSLTLASPYLTAISGSPFAAGTAPSAVVAEPYGRYLYVANSGDNTISAYSINAFTGALTPITGTFSAPGEPVALNVSNDGKYLYVIEKSAGELQQFTINADGTLTNAGGAGLGTAGATSVTTIGTYK